MLLAYCHLLLFIANLISRLHVSSPVIGSTAGTNSGVRQTARYDPDNESLGPPFDLHVVGSGNHDNTLVTSRPHDNGSEGATAPSQIPHSQPVASALMTAEDLYLPANSI